MSEKILVTTPYRLKGEKYDFFRANVSRFITYRYEKNNSNGLRFLKKNIPEIDILEFPTWDEYKRTLSEGDYDTVGFSFFTHQWPNTKSMVEEAKKENVDELWAGNYGALTYGMEKKFDRIFIGYSERDVADALGKDLETIEHPMIVDYFCTTGGVRLFRFGVLFTTRGCNVGCDFCQTPTFCSGTSKLPLSSIEDVIKRYKRAGVNYVLILDENFGSYKNHASKVASLLYQHDMDWATMTRGDILSKNLDGWYEKGLSGCLIGIESLDQGSLEDVGKNLNRDKTLNILNRLEEKRLFTIGFYILGYEKDTKKSIKQSIKKLNNYSLDMLQLTVLTPFPKTPLWDRIEEKYGMIEYDWGKWDTKHLVWDHPNITQKEMYDILEWGRKKAYNPEKFVKSLLKYHFQFKKKKGTAKSMVKIVKDIIQSNALG